MEEVPSVGDVVLARREPDLEPERACVRSTQRDASGCATCAVRFEDGFMLKGGDATTGTLATMYDGPRPDRTIAGTCGKGTNSYQPMRKQGE